MRIFLCIFSFFFMLIAANAQTTLSVSGLISSNATWQADTIFINGDVIIADGATLVIQAGVKIVPTDYYKLIVKGRLLANGTANKYIHFFVKDTTGLKDTTSTKGGWNGIHFENIKSQNDSSILKYCIISHGKAVGKIKNEQIGGAVFIDSCSKILIENCQITDNVAQYGGGGIHINFASSPKIIGNLIKHNRAYQDGGGITILENSAPLIERNIIIENVCFYESIIPNIPTFYWGNGGGIAVYSQTAAPTIKMNYVSNNVAVGGAIYESTVHIRVISNIIVNLTLLN